MGRGGDVVSEDGHAKGCEPVDEWGQGDAEEEGALEPALCAPDHHLPSYALHIPEVNFNCRLVKTGEGVENRGSG